MATHVYALTIAYNCEGQFATNILHYAFDDAGFGSTSAAAQALLTAWTSSKSGAWLDILSLHVTLLSIKARQVDGTGGFEALELAAPGTVGSRTGVMQVAGVGPCIIWYPINNNRKRGRTFLPGISEDDCHAGVITAAYKTVIQTTLGTMLTPFALTGGGAPTATPVLYTAQSKTHQTLDNAQVSMLVGTQRRRQIPV